MLYDDRKYVKELSKGSREAFESLYLRYSFLVERFVFSLVKDRAATDDITQNIFMNIWDRRKNLDKDIVFRSDLYTSARNAVYDWFRRSDKMEKVGVENASGIVGEDLSKVMDDGELLTMVNLAVSGMPETRKRIFILSRVKGLKNREIAEELGVSIKTVEYQSSFCF